MLSVCVSEPLGEREGRVEGGAWEKPSEQALWVAGGDGESTP